MIFTQAFRRAALAAGMAAALFLAGGLAGCSGLGQAQRVAEAQLANTQALAIQAKAVSDAANTCAAELGRQQVEAARRRVAASLIELLVQDDLQAVRADAERVRQALVDADWHEQAAQQLATEHPAIYDASIVDIDSGVQRLLSDAQRIDQLNRAIAAANSSQMTSHLAMQRQQLLDSYTHVQHIRQQSNDALDELARLSASLHEHIDVAQVYAQAFVDLARADFAAQSLWRDPESRQVMLEEIDEAMGSSARDRAERIGTVIDVLVGVQAERSEPDDEPTP